MNSIKPYTINDLREGRVAVINDGTVDELNKVLEYAFPIDGGGSNGKYKYYYVSEEDKDQWELDDEVTIPTQSVKVFIEEIDKPNVRLKIKVPLTLENCEFVRCNVWVGDMFSEGMVYTRSLTNKILNEQPPFGDNVSNWGFNFSPITELEYVEELKKIWVNKYPEIKEDDVFKEADGDEYRIPFWGGYVEEWDYLKDDDYLFNYQLVIYQNGVWAEKVTYEENTQVGGTSSACDERVEQPAKLTSFKISHHNGFGTMFKPVINFVEGVSFDVSDLAEVVERVVNEYLNNKQAN